MRELLFIILLRQFGVQSGLEDSCRLFLFKFNGTKIDTFSRSHSNKVKLGDSKDQINKMVFVREIGFDVFPFILFMNPTVENLRVSKLPLLYTCRCFNQSSD